jgi:hypothetical protein
MRNLSSDELAGIEQRAELCFKFGDAAALRAEDVADLIAEVRDLWEMRRGYIARTRQHLEQTMTDAAILDEMGEPDAAPPDPELDPP